MAATVSLALGLYQTLRPGSTNKLEWIEGVAILVAVIIVVVAQSVNDWQKERQFVKLNHKVNNYNISLTIQKQERDVKVLRDGAIDLISVYDLLVGDILLLDSGDIPPVDALLAVGQDVECDESSITGESRTVRKVPLDVAIEAGNLVDIKKRDPFILSGTKVLNGEGRCIVTAVGKHSLHGRMMLGKSS